MLPQSIKNHGGQARKLAAIRGYLKSEVVLGRPVFVTDMLMEKEPERTFLFMSADGHVLNGSAPMVDTDFKVDLPTVRLMTIDEKQTIMRMERSQQRIPGTELVEEVTRHVRLGNDAVVDHSAARDLLWKNGYPFLNNRTRGAKQGFIVEVAWLEAEAKKADCLPELLEL